MKKTFPLHQPGKDDRRVVDAIKHDVRKYVKRERRKTLPAGVDFWDFACKVGQDQAEPAVKHLAEVAAAIDAAASSDATAVYIEILSIPGHRAKKPPIAGPDSPPETAAPASPSPLPTDF